MESPIRRKLYRRHASELNKLVYQEDSIENIGPKDVLLKVHAVSLNYRDVNILNGTNPWPVLTSGIPCSDAAGEIIAIGSDVKRFSVGDRVFPIVDQKSITGQEQEREWLGGEVNGILASHLVFDEERLVKIPGYLSWTEATSLPCAGVTAWTGLAVNGELLRNKTILIQGLSATSSSLPWILERAFADTFEIGTGGVSLMAAKLAAAADCKVILTSSSDEKLRRVNHIDGLAEAIPINYKTNPEWHEEAVRVNNMRGADIVIENGGTSSLLQSCAAVAKRGIISQVGYLGPQNTNDLKDLLPALIEKAINLR